MSGGFRCCRAVLGIVSVLALASVAACQGGGEPSGSGSAPASSRVSSTSPVSPTPSISSSASDESERFVVDEVDDGLKVEWVSTDVTDTSFEGTYRVTNMTGEDVWLAGGSYVVPDAVTGGYTLANAFMPVDPSIDYETEPVSGVSLLESGESSDEGILVSRPFEVSAQMEDDPAMIVDMDSTRMCVGYVLASDLPEGVPKKGLLNGFPDVYALSDQTGFKLQHVSCSESIELD